MARVYEVVPEIERRRVGLDQPDKESFLVLDEYNKVRVDALYDFDSLEPTGSLSPLFLKRAARTFLDAYSQNKARGIVR